MTSKKLSPEQTAVVEAGNALVLSRTRRVWDKGQWLCKDCFQHSEEQTPQLIPHAEACPTGRLQAAIGALQSPAGKR